MSEESLSLATAKDALDALQAAWPLIVDECRAVLGGELHYQAVTYHCFRNVGVPRAQIGMNVKQWIVQPISDLFRQKDLKKHPLYRGGFEPIPDIVLFSAAIQGDFRRRNYDLTLRHMVLGIEIKASERKGGRLTRSELIADVEKLTAHREEVRYRGGEMAAASIIIDSAPLRSERLDSSTVSAVIDRARILGITLLYVSPDNEIFFAAD